MSDAYSSPDDADPLASLNRAPAPETDPFRAYMANKDVTKPAAANSNDPFRSYMAGKDMTKPAPAAAEPASSSTGALVRGAIRSIAPTLGGLATFGPGAEIGAAVGAFGGPAAPITVPLGGLIGGTITSLGGSYAVSAAQNWALSRLPDSWKESLDSQQKLDEEKHPDASYLGGLLPMLVAMRPGAFTRGELPENSTALQRIMANPVTARIFGGAVMGGMELGQEAAIEDHADWRKVAIATGFGIVFNQPTRLGQAITEIGARPARRMLGREIAAPVKLPEEPPVPSPDAEAPVSAPVVPAEPVTPAAAPFKSMDAMILAHEAQAPTVAQSGDVKVMGPGITESVFHGGETINPAAAMTAHETARNEQAVFGAPNVPDLHATARQFEPEIFAHYDDLLERRETFRKWIEEYHTPSQEALSEIEGRQAELQRKHDEFVASRGGYQGGPEARRLRAQIRAVDAEHADALSRMVKFAVGEATETPELAAARKHLMATDMEIRDMLPEVRAAYRRAADRHGTETLPVPEVAAQPTAPATTPSLTTMLAEHGADVQPRPIETPAAPFAPAIEPQAAIPVAPAPKAVEAAVAPAPPPPPKPIEEQRAAISNDVSQKLIAAGRPAEEAQAYGALWADYYETRAGRFNGARGTPEELYRREGAQIRGNGNELQRRQATLEGLRRAVSATPRAPRDPSTLSLLEFLASRGGIDPNDALIGDVRSLTGGKRKFVPGFGDLVRQGGMRLDAAREAAVEAGYLHDPGAESRTTESTSTINTLLEAMDSEIRGERVYPHGRKPERVLEAEQKRTIEENERHADEELDRALTDIGVTNIDPKLRQRAVEIMTGEGERDPMTAYERAVMEDESAPRRTEKEREHVEEFYQARRASEMEFDWTPGGGAKEIKIGDTTIEYGVSRDGTNGEIILIKTPKTLRGQGSARIALKALLAEADRRNTTMFLNSEPMDKGISKSGLDAFYKSLGFVKNTGRNKDFASRAEFVRQPQEPDELFQKRDLTKSITDTISPGKSFTVHHGSKADFTTLDPKKINSGEYGRGFYLSEVPHEASYYGREGNIYQAQIGADKDAFLDWHRILATQSDSVRAGLKKLGIDDVSLTGDQAYRRLLERFGPNKAEEKMRNAGVPGIRYLDQASRPLAATRRNFDNLTYNFVLFDDALAKITHKNGERISSDNSLFQETPANLDGPERIVGAAIVADGRVFIGPMHLYAIDQARKAGANYMHVYKNREGREVDGGFFTSKGRYVSRQEAVDIANKAGQYDPGPEWLAQSRKKGLLAEAIRPDRRSDDSFIAGWQGQSLPKSATDEGGLLSRVTSQLVSLFDLFQEARGKIRLVPNNKSIITLMKDANASTFGHESGHEFLNQLMQDADHAQAPEQLKTDAATTLKWLGVESADDIKTRHHEKFATGFEQYLREGVAPSPGLARVFAQFRDWLLKIYQTLRGLGKEISPDIRDVFDRMLALEPQRTVIAPEALERGPTLHDIHAADAATMEPHEADAAMARAAVETQRFTDDIPPERMHEFEAERARWEAEQIAATGAEPGPAPRGGEGEPSDMGPHGGEPEPIAPSSGNRAQSGAVVGRSGDAGREGNGTPSLAGTERGAAAFAEQHPLASGPADLFGVADTPLLDKAGNIRLENLTTSEEVRAAYRASAERNDNFIGERGGKVTDGEVLNLAYDMGMQGAEKLVQKWVVRQALNAEQIMAVRLLSRQSAQAVHDAHVRVAQTNDPEAILAQVEAEARHDMIQATLSGITAEAGRAMRALRHIRDEAGMKTAEQIVKEATGKTLFQKLEEAKLAASLDTPQEVAKHMNDRKKRSYGRMVVEYFINGKLSGFATQVTNVVGNTITLGQHSGPETAVAALIGAAAHALGREGSYIRLGEIPARLRGLREGLPGALKATGQSFYAGTNLLLPGEKPQKMPFQIGNELAKNPILDEAATYASIGADMFGTIQGLRDGIIATGELIKAGGVEGAPAIGTRYSLTGSIPDLTVRGVTALPLGTITRMPGRFLVAADAFFKASNYSMAKNAMAYRMASDEGHVGTAFDARVADIRQNPSEELMEQLHAEAAEQTLMEKGGKFLAALSHLSNVEIGGFPMLKFVSPFVHVAGNIINQTVMKRTPLAFLSTELRADLTGRNGNAAQDQAMARVLIGTGLAITIGTLAAQGYVDGSGPTDRNEAAEWIDNGHLPHSVRIGDMMFEMQKLGPLGLLIGIAADLYQVSKSASEGEMTEAASHLVHAFSQNILDQSMMKGPSDLLRAITDSDRYGEQYVRSFLSSFLPADVLMAQIAKQNDPYIRQARTVVDAIRVKIPGHLNNWFENELFPKRDIWGDRMTVTESFGGPAISGIHYRQLTTDPVKIAMLELKMNPGPVPRKIRNVDLTDEQFDDFARIAGRTTKIRLDKIVASPDFQRWAPHIRRDVINEVLRQSREMARGTVMVKYPQIIKDATEERLKKARGED